MLKMLSLIKNYWFGITLFILAAITFLSLWPLPELPEVPGTDKTHHFIAYGLLMVPTGLRKPKRWLLYPVFFIAYSGMIELIQPMVNRYGEWPDLGANALGLVCGMVVAEVVGLLGRVGEKVKR
ncbi:MAG: VanZ family protein [Candidatus Pacearchaeota archaeon]|nr:VanZ family protein [Candidatus Pacearchaeota archaeon]